MCVCVGVWVCVCVSEYGNKFDSMKKVEEKTKSFAEFVIEVNDRRFDFNNFV